MKRGQEVFVAKLYNKPVFDPNGDQVGRVRDIVLIISPKLGTKAVGLVIEIAGKRRIFLHIDKVTSFTNDRIVITGNLNLRRFQKRELETLAYVELLGRSIKTNPKSVNKPENELLSIEDFSIELQPNGDWNISRFYVGAVVKGNSGFKSIFKKNDNTKFVPLEDLQLFKAQKDEHQWSDHLLESIEEMKPADAADVILELDEKRQAQVAGELDNERLADVLEEMSEDDQISLLSNFEQARVADVLEEMEPDDAADLLGKMTEHQQEELLEQMNPEDAEEVRQLLVYDEDTAGGLMTTNPVIVSPNSTVAYALAQIRREELPPSLASLVFVCQQPLETPTGTLMGVLHFQQLLRYPPHMQVGGILDTDFPVIYPDYTLNQVSRIFATYNTFIAPVVNQNTKLLGAISVDDVLDHILPDNWREEEFDESADAQNEAARTKEESGL